jgi:hypothetical protein
MEHPIQWEEEQEEVQEKTDHQELVQEEMVVVVHTAA